MRAGAPVQRASAAGRAGLPRAVAALEGDGDFLKAAHRRVHRRRARSLLANRRLAQPQSHVVGFGILRESRIGSHRPRNAHRDGRARGGVRNALITVTCTRGDGSHAFSGSGSFLGGFPRLGFGGEILVVPRISLRYTRTCFRGEKKKENRAANKRSRKHVSFKRRGQIRPRHGAVPREEPRDARASANARRRDIPRDG